MDEIISEFIVESLEGLDRLDQALIFLEETPDDKDTITEVFRILHTIKGTCGFLAFGQLEKVAHRGENLLSLLRDSVLEMDDDIANALLATVDAIRSILATIEETGEEGQPDNDALLAELERLSGRADHAAPPAPPPAAAEPEPQPQAAAEPESAPEPESEAAPAPEAEAEPAAAAEAEPAAAAEPGQQRIGDILVDDDAASRTDVEIAAAEQSLGDDRKIGKILTDDGKTSQEDVERAATKQRTSTAESTIRVDVGLLNQLMNLVGELVLSRNQIIQLAESGDASDFSGPAQRLSLITAELQEGVMKTRMQPIGNVWGKLPRVVRDLSRQFGKELRLEMEGKETELDRTILEAIKDPLTHMVRNTVDHGIEDPETRVAAGKPSEGVLRLRANHEGGQVIIEISDDGAGIDASVIRQKVVDKGLVAAETAERMSDSEAVQLVFMPGFSTAAAVSNVSGRGVGMDVVKSNIERIGGSVEIKTERGAGTTFKIKIPLTLAIIPALSVRCASNRYAIPQMSLLELVRLSGDDRIEEVHGAPVYRLRGRLLPIVYLNEVLGTDDTESDRTVRNIVVLQADDRQFGLVVDEIEDTEEIVVKPLGREVQHIPFFSGATIMGDGSVSLILDVLGLATESSILNPGSRRAESPADSGEESTSMHDLVGDRTLLLVSVGDDMNVAVPLDDIDRLEEFAGSQIEQSDHSLVVQYRDGIMPLLDLGQIAGYGSIDHHGQDRISVVVCARGDTSIGVVVDRVLDIVAGATIREGLGGGPDTAIIGGKVTDIVDLAGAVDHLVPLPVPSEPVGSQV